MKNKLGFDEKYFEFNRYFIHYFKDGNGTVWFKTADLDEAMEVKLNIDETNGFDVQKIKNRNYAMCVECIDKITNVEKTSSQKFKFPMIKTLKEVQRHPDKTVHPYILDNPNPPPLHTPLHKEKPLPTSLPAFALKQGDQTINLIQDLQREIRELRKNMEQLIDENTLLKHSNQHLKKWGKI